jgi:predicted metal-dependent hydrolase
MASRIKEPQFWINPNFRLCFPLFRIEWHKIDDNVLRQESRIKGQGRFSFSTKNNSLLTMVRADNSGLDLIYSDSTNFENLRLQSWLRKTIRDQVIVRAKEVLPARLHELENIHQIKARGVQVRKLRKGVLGQCNSYKMISLSPLLVIFPMDFMDMVILHEMAHLKYMHHRKTFWQYLSLLLHDDAKQQNDLRDIVLSKYVDFYIFLMK